MSTFGGAVVDVGDALVDDGAVVMEVVVEFALIDQLGVFGVHRLYLHSHLQVGLGVDGLVDLSECTFVDLPNHFEVLPYLLQHLRHWNNKYYTMQRHSFLFLHHQLS